MIVTRGFSRDTTDDENGSVTLYGLGSLIVAVVVPLLLINMDGQMQNLDGGMRG